MNEKIRDNLILGHIANEMGLEINLLDENKFTIPIVDDNIYDLVEKLTTYSLCKSMLGKKRINMTDDELEKYDLMKKQYRERIQKKKLLSYNENDKNQWISSDEISNFYELLLNNNPIFSYIFPTYNDKVITLFKEKYDNIEYKGLTTFDKWINNSYKNCHRYLTFIYNQDDNISKDGRINGGSHWIACVVDIWKCCIYHFDPLREYCGQQCIVLKTFIQDIKSYLTKRFGKCDIIINDAKIQYDGTECGVYCCNFVIRMINGEDFYDIVNNRLTKNEIETCRIKYWSNINGGYCSKC